MDKYTDMIDKQVTLIPLECNGNIKEVIIRRTGTMYLIRYWNKGEMNEAYCYENELIFGAKSNG